MTRVASTGRSNRRLTTRRVCQLGVRYRAGKDWHPALALDLSRSGCRLRLGEPLARGAAVRVAFEAPLRDGSRALTTEAPGHVIWCRLEGLSHQTGIQFNDVPDGLDELIASLG